MSRYHVVDDHCGIAGGEDFGAFDTREDAEKAIQGRQLLGDKGGCRCGGSGYLIQTCEERENFHVYWEEMRQGHHWFVRARPTDRLKRDLTPEEIANHKCHNYNPERFEEVMNRIREATFKKAFPWMEDSDENSGDTQ